MVISKELLNIIVCPKCKNDIINKNMFLICEVCQLAYPILDSTIPDLLLDDAWPLIKASKIAFKHKINF